MYMAMVNFVDGLLGRVVTALKAKGMWDNLLWVSSADNGGPIYSDGSAGANNWPMRGGKMSNWQGGIRVNAYASGGFLPAAVRGTTVGGLIETADMYTTLQAGRSFLYTVGKNLDMLGSDHVRQVRKDCASVILWTAEKATWMAGEGIQIFGGNGYTNEYPLGRIWRDAKLYEIGAGTSEVRRMLIGRELFNETA